MKLTQTALAAAFAIAGGLFSLDAAAHSLWLEGDSAASKLYFGEYGENLRETSPGKLDNIITPAVTLIDAAGAEQPVNASRNGDHFAIPAGAAVLVRALRQPVRESARELQGGGSAAAQKSYLYARSGKGGNLLLDLQHEANLLRLSFMGKPLAKAEIVITAPSGWEKRLHTDEKGEAAFSLPESGLYVAEARHTLNNPGEFEGKAYTVERHTVTLSLYK